MRVMDSDSEDGWGEWSTVELDDEEVLEKRHREKNKSTRVRVWYGEIFHMQVTIIIAWE
jgi:pyruvate-formate lyase-activating enzyme